MASLESVANNAQGWVKTLQVVQGIDLSTNAHLKVLDEAEEYADDQSLEEAADVFIALMVSLAHKKYSAYDLAQAADAKMTVNRAREWEQLPGGTFQHK